MCVRVKHHNEDRIRTIKLSPHFKYFQNENCGRKLIQFKDLFLIVFCSPVHLFIMAKRTNVAYNERNSIANQNKHEIYRD